ncbi:MAG: Crp/Fnr family transcriptional regulator [Chitinivibrionales bacterium]|nr:Crp/Fnr family transcriptional regulator [Chitinivibrionales bacterium]
MISMDIDEVELFLSKVGLFQGLSKSEYSAIAATMIQKPFADKETIVYEDDHENNNFFIIVSGKVNVSVITQEGKQAILATLQRGDFFGEMTLLDGEPRSASVIAASDGEMLILYRKSFMDILHNYPKITIQMLVTLSRRLRRTNRQINTLSMMSVYGRIADVIIQISREQGERVGDMIVVNGPPTQQEIAEMAGTSRETVSRILSQLRKKHYITMNRRRLVILNEKKLYY